MTRYLALTLSSAILLVAACGAADAVAQRDKGAATPLRVAAKAKAPSKTNTTRGTIVSIDGDKVVLSHKDKKTGKTQERTYFLTKDTSRLGYLKRGNDAIVHYQSLNNANMASSVLGVRKPEKANHKG